MIWRKSGVGRDGKMKNTNTFRVDHEYVLVGYKRNKFLNKSFTKPNFVNKYDNPDNDPRGAYKAGSISNKEEASNSQSDNFYTVVSPSGRSITRQFNFSKEIFDELNNDRRIYWGKNGNSIPAIKIFVNEKRFVTTSSILDENTMTTTRGKKEIEEILGFIAFDNPKPIELVKRLIQIGSINNATILDFFAGSGTTGHAVMELNIEDGGNRRFILCTDNSVNREKTINFLIKKGKIEEEPEKKQENKHKEWEEKLNDYLETEDFKELAKSQEYQSLGICQSITYQRLKTVITGKRKDGSEYSEGIPANLKYFKTDWTKRHPEDYFLSHALLLHIREMIELQNAIKVDNKKYVVVLREKDFADFVVNNADRENIKKLWIREDLILSAENSKVLQTIKYAYIPREYFSVELQEVGE